MRRRVAPPAAAAAGVCAYLPLPRGEVRTDELLDGLFSLAGGEAEAVRVYAPRVGGGVRWPSCESTAAPRRGVRRG